MPDDVHSILIAEDDEHTAAFLAQNLAADGFRVATAAAAGETQRALEVRKPDLLLLDLMLEGSSGLAVLDRVRSADGLASRIDPQLPVIVVSGLTDEAARVRGFARGADDYVTNLLSLVPPRARAARLSAGKGSAAVGAVATASVRTTGLRT